MKMAKASQADLDAAIGICSALEAIDRGFMPEGFDTDDGDRSDFDIDDGRDCRNVLVHLLDLVGNGSIGRVVWGMSVLLDPNNEAVDPDLDYIEHHPKRLEGNKAVEQRDELLAAHAEMAKQVANLRHELRRYQEREATMGWNQS